MLQGAYEKGQANKEEFKQDLEQGMTRAKEEAQARRLELAPSDPSATETRIAPVAGGGTKPEPA